MATSPFDRPIHAGDDRSLLAGRLPAVQRELAEVLARRDFDPVRVELLVGYDPILCAQVLRSARSGRDAGSVEDLFGAITWLGAEALREVVHCVAPTGGRWNWTRGRRASGPLLELGLARSIAARHAMRRRDPALASLAHTAGALSVLGELVMLHVHGEAWLELWQREQDGTERDLEQERARFGVDRRQAAEELAQSWRLPPRLVGLLAGRGEGPVAEVLDQSLRLLEGEAPAPPEVQAHLQGFASLLGSHYKGPGDLGRLLEASDEPRPPCRPVSLHALGELLGTLDDLDDEERLLRWLRRVVLDRTNFERARVAAWDPQAESYRELWTAGEGDEVAAELSASALRAVLQPPGRRSYRISEGADLGGLSPDHPGDGVVLPMGVDHEGQTIALLLLDRPYSGRPPRRQDLELVELLARGAAARVESRRLRSALEAYRVDAERDYLTGIYNRRSTMRLLEREMARARRHETPLALALLDIDNFKTFNDMYGHLAGDDVLREVAGVLTETARESDVVGRYGGEEFLIVLPEATIEAAYMFAERLRGVVEAFGQRKLDEYPDNPPTISIGVSWVVAERDTPEDAIERVDRALYASKRAGRNRVCLEPAEPSY